MTTIVSQPSKIGTENSRMNRGIIGCAPTCVLLMPTSPSRKRGRARRRRRRRCATSEALRLWLRLLPGRHFELVETALDERGGLVVSAGDAKSLLVQHHAGQAA